MLQRSNFRNSGRSIKVTVACVGLGLLILQTVRSSAQIYTYGWQFSGASQFTVNGNVGENFTYNSPDISSGTLWLTVDETPSDPTLTINGSIDNQSSFAWTGYILDIGMDQTFSINSANVTAPAGWTAGITQPSGPDSNGNYTGTIDYFMTAGGTPVAISPAANSTLSFAYQIEFNGTTSYSVTQTATPVPEPSAFGFLLLGGIFLGGRMFLQGGRTKRAKVRMRS